MLKFTTGLEKVRIRNAGMANSRGIVDLESHISILFPYGNKWLCTDAMQFPIFAENINDQIPFGSQFSSVQS